MQNRYSIVISPPDNIIALVKSKKEALAQQIGWFHSKNSLAHITINEFIATDSELERINMQLNTICNMLCPIEVRFDHYDSYPNGAFFIAPDEISKKELKDIMKQVLQSLRVKTIIKNREPHLSIARQLKPKELAVAYYMFASIDMSFICDSISLRRFNPNLKQFEIIQRFVFNDNPSPIFYQGTLF